MLVNCFQCGSSLGPGAKYCSLCGASVPRPTAPTPSTFPTPTGQPQTASRQGSRSWQKWGIGLAVGIGLLVTLALIIGPSEAPFNPTPGPDVTAFTVSKEWDIPAGGSGAELVVDDSATREEVIKLGQWLLDKNPDDQLLLLRVYNSSEQLAVVSEWPGEYETNGVTWLADLPELPTPDMPFDKLKTFAMQLEYDELYRNMDKYSIDTWRKSGGPTPLLYFAGEIRSTEALRGLLEGVWAAQLILSDNDFLVFTYEEPTLRVGDKVKFVGVCEELGSFQNVDGSSHTIPFCTAWLVNIVSSS